MPARTATRGATRSATSRARWVGWTCPTSQRAGLGCIAPLAGVRSRRRRRGGVGHHAARVGGEGQHDRPLGDRRACTSTRPFPTYPAGIPAGADRRVRAAHRARRASATSPASGTAMLDRLRRRARADRGVDRLHVGRLGLPGGGARGRSSRSRSCTRPARPRGRMLVAPHDVSRVIARPFVGAPGRLCADDATGATSRSRRPWRRCSTPWRPRAYRAPGWARWTTCSPGGGSRSAHDAEQREGHHGDHGMAPRRPESGFLFANLVDFDQVCRGTGTTWRGSMRALREFDGALPATPSEPSRG